jgi:hypothetical protein
MDYTLYPTGNWSTYLTKTSGTRLLGRTERSREASSYWFDELSW